MTVRQALLALAAYASANAVIEHLIFIPLLAAPLSRGELAAGWLVAMYVPLLGATVLVTRWARTTRHAIFYGVLATVVVQFHKGVLGWLHMEGHAQGLAARDPMAFVVVGTLRVGVGLVLLHVACALAWRRWRSRSRRIG